MPQLTDARRLSHLLWEVSSRSAAYVEAEMSETGLSPTSHGVLDVIAANPGTSIAEMTQWVPTTVQAISQNVARLERRGLITRSAGPRGRTVALHLTRKGQRAFEEADHQVQGAAEAMRTALGEREYTQLVRLLEHADGRLAELTGSRAGRRLVAD